ncbi:hypothetical protein SPRG_18428 [Saprolegnia parasitica CBS 223.65]|uniref:Uncharacterized protein n=1 Tax=Saprolegnia parasitica (strain CBS 223.65) TaxID=695850 RepID=A0A067BH11_SAPPC|nr:hypothetical protein SPRG_18428 [Saprolegnia parasitica CBS 223.65]KDO16035.1 hypothetical protein SPRG_18428 [Saprolegnia parasitica CBS 223.65]|eukprot:XP_012213256.1 hypothetical protein SPRG_18428 [Saprolegnia parasitica CBS 223.65]
MRQNNVRQLKAAAPPPPIGVRAVNPPEPRIRTQRSFISKSTSHLPAPPSFDADIELTPEVCRRLVALRDDVEMLLEHYTSLHAKHLQMQAPPTSNGVQTSHSP